MTSSKRNNIAPTLRKKLTPKAQAELVELTVLLGPAIEERKLASEAEKSIKSRILEIVKDYDLPLVSTAVTQALNVPEAGASLRVTRSEARLSIDPQALLDLVGPEAFFDLCTVTKVDFNLDIWDLFVKQERFKASDFTRFIKQPDEDPSETKGLTLTVGPLLAN